MAEIIDIKTPWEGHSGNEVESVVKRTFNTKHGASYFDPATNTMLYFASKDDLSSWLSSGDDTLIIDSAVMNFTGTMYQVKVQSEMSKNLYFTTQADKAEITVSFASQKKGITDVSWQDIVEDYNVSVYIDKGSTGAFTPLILDQFVMSGNSFTFDVRKSLATGPNRIRIVAVGSESADKAQGSEVFIVNLTSMYLAPSNFTWYKPFIEGETYALGGMNIGGNLSKTLKIKVSKEGYEKLYEVNLGSEIYTTTAYTFRGMTFPEAGTGVYNVEIWLDAGGLESDHLIYNIICVSEADKFTAQLVAIGSPAPIAYNFTDNELFQYCIYNGGTATGTPHIRVAYIVNTNPTTIIDEDLVNVATATALPYTASLEIEMEDESAALSLETYMTYGNEQVLIYPVDNSKSYPATTGAVFYMNPSARNNAQSNREKIINSISATEIDATFTRMAWTDGTDGWTTDDEGRKCLRLPAGCPMEMSYQPMASVSQKTIEFVYKVKNAADYDEPIISICSDTTDPNFRGIKITPKNILIHSRDLNVNDSLQDYNTTDEETLHVLVTIIPNYKTNYGNLAQIYCNGSKVRSFSFETADRWDVAANVKMGSSSADLFVYKMRVYDRGFESYDALKNYINSLPNASTKEAAKAEIEAPLNDSYKLSYDDCVRNNLNTMVIEILDQDQTIPSIAKPSAKQCNLWVKIHNPMEGEMDEDFTNLFSGVDILNQTIEGQGTTAMTYARWNFRWKLDSTYNKRRITAKKNFASSMHSHKMGATRLFNDLNAAVVGANDAGKRTAVYQYPVYGFQKILVEGTTDQYLYEPIGLYTIGPDKGDKKTFGFDDEAYESTLIHLEGTDHTPKGVGFDYPWEELAYSGSAEALGAVNASGAVVGAWECGAAGEYDPKDNPTEVKTMLDSEFQPAYNVAYNNSTYIEGVTETLAEMNADIATWQAKTDAEGRSYSGLEFFTDGVYDLYFYNTRTQQYESNGVNLLTDLGLTADGVASLTLAEKTELFKSMRRARFVETWGNFWHTQDCIFHYTFVLLFGATDNFKKNTYPYKFKAFMDGGKYRWRQDDLDTLADINNQGLAAKIYSILVGDKTATGSGSIYRGDTSVLWTLIKETQQTEIKAMVHSIYDAMVELCPSGYGDTTLQKLVGCVRYYFWDKAQAYFPASAYNMDAEWTYEDTWAAGLYKEVNPLSQSLGGHYEAERDWITMRVLFTAMYYNYGPFGAVNDSFSDTSTGQIAYGGAGAHTFAIVMACDGNPTILRGQSELVTIGERVKAGELVELTVPDSSGADTRIYVQGVDWMESVGDLSTLQVSADNPTLSLSSKRMQNFKIGDEDATKVTTNVTGLSFGDCPSMLVIDARNASTITGTIDLSKMPRLMEAYFGGTGVKAVNVPNGSKIAVLELGEETTQISLMNLKFMENEGFQYSSLPKLEFLRIENCSQLSPFQLLKGIYETEGNVIRDIRIIGFDVEGDASDFTMIANMANDVDKDGNEHIYNGISAEGEPMDNSHPVIEGTLSVAGNVYEDDYNAISAVFPNLNMSFLGFYLKFADPEVLRILLEKMTTDDGIGITKEQAAAVTSMISWFAGNTVIETFDEFKNFTGITSLTYQYFQDCSSLKSIVMPNTIKSLGDKTFANCTSLENCPLPESIEKIGSNVFLNTKIGGVIHLPNLTSLGYYAKFSGTNITKITSLGSITNFGSSINDTATLAANCKLLESVVLPETLTTISRGAFYGCTALVECNIPQSVTFIDQNAFNGCTALVIEELTTPNLTSFASGAFGGVQLKKWTNMGSIKTLNKIGSTVLEKLVVPSTVTTLGASALSGCAALTDLTFDLTPITTINGYVFSNSIAFEGQRISFPNLTTIGNYAFNNSLIEAVDDLGSITSIPRVFETCPNLKSVTLPATLTSIGAYFLNNAPSLETLIVRNPTPPTLHSNAFVQVNSTFVIAVPAASISSYAEASYWTRYASRLAPLEDHEDGGYVPFADSAVLAICVANWDTNGSGYMSKNECAAVTDLGTKFKGNTEIVSFEELKYFANVQTLNVDAFNGCSSLTKVNIPHGLTASGNSDHGVFKNCTSLVDVTFEDDSITIIPAYAFHSCSALENITLPSSTNRIEGSAFQNCGRLTTITNWNDIAPNITYLGGYAFRDVPLDIGDRLILPNLQTLGGPNLNTSSIQYVLDLGSITILPRSDAGLFSKSKTTLIILPATLLEVGAYSLYNTDALTTLICKAETPPTLGTGNRRLSNCTIYVPDVSVAGYQAATNWSTHASRIKGISQLATDNPTLYAEIEEYL